MIGWNIPNTGTTFHAATIGAIHWPSVCDVIIQVCDVGGSGEQEIREKQTKTRMKENANDDANI